ncbi:MAG: hypothetical protein CMI09_08375 [Oceanospirillaceae bacterium]|nr:hypothetical protein [Oceanospirillaceae bacterium]
MNKFSYLYAFLVFGGLSPYAIGQNALEPGIEEAFSFSLDAPFAHDEDIPIVLTAARLKQPRAEVPASVTVIESEQIDAWGVRSLQELMRFVPGMFIGHGDDENNASVAYHASTPNIMRRLQVLVDGRSVFRAGIASVIWDDIPVALEDIQRIEVTRGPNSATYGSNSFLGVINIVTKHPKDTLGTRIRYRNGSQGIDDTFLSHSWMGSEKASYRLSARLQADDGFDGKNAENGDDEYRDSRRHGFVTLTHGRTLDSTSSLNVQLGIKKGHTDIRKDGFADQIYPDQKTDQGYMWAKYQKEFSHSHFGHFQAYWQYDRRRQDNYACVPTSSFDPAAYDLYRLNPDLATTVALGMGDVIALPEVQQLVQGVALGVVSPEMFEAALLQLDVEVDVTEQELGLVSDIFQSAFNGTDFSNLSEEVCANSDRRISDERFDFEYQDTKRWNKYLRTVAGVNMRRDQVHSETYFGGKENNDTYRVFLNAELRPFDKVIINAGFTQEWEDDNDKVFSPRLAINFLLGPQQSIRLVRSEAVRSPDMLEQNPNYRLTGTSMTENYLGVEESVYFMHQWPSSRRLDHEKIVSHELGYYARFGNPDIEIDIKVYHEHMTQLISDPISLNSLDIASDTQMDVEGAEMQLNWRVGQRNWVWLTSAYVNADVVPGGDLTGLSSQQLRDKKLSELRLSAQDSVVVSWHHKAGLFSGTLSHFWYDAYNPLTNDPNRYRRYEVNLRADMDFGRYSPWFGVNWQRLVDPSPLVYINQRYSEEDIIFLQAGLNF